MNTGRSLKILIAKHDITQVDIANHFGTSRASVNRMCNKKTASPKMLKKYADYFGISVSELIKIGEE